MNLALERRLNQFQAKVQQEVFLVEDQIRRSQLYFDTLEAERAEMEDKLSRLQTQSQQRHHEEDGRQKKRAARVQSQAALLNRDHQLEITEILARAKETDDAMRLDFETQVELCDNAIQKKAQEKLAPIEATIARTQAMIAKYRDPAASTQIDEEPISEAESEVMQRLHREKLKALTQMLKDRNAERLEALTKAREQLSECVQTLEDLESHHSLAVSNLIERLASTDTRYEEKLHTITDDHKRKTDAVRRKAQEAEKKAKRAQQSLQDAEKRYAFELNELTVENGLLKTEFQRVTAEPVNAYNLPEQLSQAESLLSQKKTELQKLEECVIQLRSDTHRMARDVARMNHEAAIAKRRAALGVF
jgi:hypothetical protein